MNSSQKELVSVIVPIYKVEEYLRECVDSIINQTYKNLEIILVDDGSPDKCGEICDEYAKNDSRITVYHKENGGLSDARNYGLERSHGEYITFVDSDDFLNVNFVGTLMELIQENDADVAVAYEKIFIDSSITNDIRESRGRNVRMYSQEEALLSLLYQEEDGTHTGAHGKVYRRGLFEGIRYPVGLFMEDLATTYRIFFKCRKIAYTSKGLYYYRLRHDSQLHMSYSPKMMSCIPISRQLYGEISEKRPELKTAAASRAFSANRTHFFLLPKDHKEERMQVWEEMKKYRREVLFDPHARKRERLAALMTYAGSGFFYLFSKLYRRYLMRERG